MSGPPKASSGSCSEEPKTRDLREKLKHADMSLFDRFMKKVIVAPKKGADKGQADTDKERGRRG